LVNPQVPNIMPRHAFVEGPNIIRRPRMSERVMSGKLAILPSEVEPLTQVCGTPFHALWFAISKR
jgi:hypothetical protein